MRGHWVSQTRKLNNHYQSAGNSGVHRIMYSTYPVGSVVWGQTNPTTARTGEHINIYVYSPNYATMRVNVLYRDGTRITYGQLSWWGSGSNRYFQLTMPAQDILIIAVASDNFLFLNQVPIDTSQHLIQVTEITPHDQPYMVDFDYHQNNTRMEDYIYTPNTQVKIKVTATPPSYIYTILMTYTSGPYAGQHESATAEQITNGYIYTFTLRGGNALFNITWG